MRDTPARPSTAASQSLCGLSRRSLMTGSAAAALALPAGLVVPSLGHAAAGAKAQAAGYYRLPLGEFSVTIVSDGAYELPVGMFATNAKPEDVQAFLAANMQPTTTRTAHVNLPVIDTGKDRVLIDVGGGPNWMPTAGRLADNLTAAGIEAASITKVVITHGHPDHIWGLIDEFEDAPRFPNAEHIIAAREWDFWTTDEAAGKLPAAFQGFALGAKTHLPPLAEKIRRIKPGDEIVPGIVSIDTPGHTPGHLAVAVTSGSQTLIVAADTLTHAYISFANPGWWAGVDTDPAQAEASRRKILDMLATDKAMMLGYHLSFPGLGYTVRDGAAYRFVPATWQW
ncbi:MAG: MBL fold metallo-hydrolase [Hyphomicrobiaceae bacterium]|nr:MBL fold metallo-hydrolase [Hyphomicrobiaceae bacterium]